MVGKIIHLREDAKSFKRFNFFNPSDRRMRILSYEERGKKGTLVLFAEVVNGKGKSFLPPRHFEEYLGA